MASSSTRRNSSTGRNVTEVQLPNGATVFYRPAPEATGRIFIAAQAPDRGPSRRPVLSQNSLSRV